VIEGYFLGEKDMLRFAQFLTFMTAVGLLLTACDKNVSNIGWKTVVITPAIKGNSASLNVGDTLEIHIPTIPTAGFEWEAQDLDTTILLQEGSAVYTQDSGPNSAGGIVTLIFKTVGAGKTTFNLLYVNSLSNGAPSLSMNSFSMTVEVK
jgi:predicted secreted protein